MAKVAAGRMSADLHAEHVVFLIGMRVNKPWKVHKWAPIFRAMPKMLRELSTHPELGLLHVQNGMLSGHPFVLCYFASPEHLYRFAKDPTLTHLEAWRAFNRAVRNSGDVGIWHETYRVSPATAETVYGNMPPWGLGAAAGTVPASARGNSAEYRAGLVSTDEPTVEPY
jgi:hypothetical protein